MTQVPGSADARTPTGLTQAQAEARLAAEGPNELPGMRRRTPLAVVREVVGEPMFALLLGAGAVYLALGDLQEALILMAFATLSVGITVTQALRTERVLERLRELSSPRALVIRDGAHRRIAGSEVVRGDLLVVAEGDRVAADAVLRAVQDLQADESLLTGESVPVGKRAVDGDPPARPPGGDGLPFLYSGSMIVHGQGIAEVRATGARSRIGQIGLTLGGIRSEAAPLQVQTRRLVRAVALAGLLLSLGFVLAYGLTRDAWLEGLLGGIALAMSLLPEEFPLVLTIFMAMGAWRISQARVLTRRSAAIETLGAATVLCTDKTGTMTRNRMAIVLLEAGLDDAAASWAATGDTGSVALDPPLRRLLEIGAKACAVDPFDPMDRAFHELVRRLPPGAPDPAPVLVRVHGLRPDLLAVTQVWRGPDDRPLVATKGAPEAVADLCRLPAAARTALRARVEAIAARGIRVLAVGVARPADGAPPASPRDVAFEFLGLVGLADPLRPGVPDAVRQCREAGIRVVMITGDHPATARAIAAQAGLEGGAVLSGTEMETLDDAALTARVDTVSVFARIMPEQKLRLIQAFKARGDVVAMTGDGVNDAPSLKAAHIGIAMGGRGTDVAREASSLVLLDDDFGSIVRTIRLGRRIHDNLRKAMQYILAVHVPIAGVALLPLLFGAPLVLGPIHIAFLEMVIDPVCSIVFEAESEESDVMARPPREPDSPLFPGRQLLWSLLQGGFAFAVLAGIYAMALRRGMPDDEVRALTFVSLVITNVSLILVNRSFSASLAAALRRPNPALWWVVCTAAALLGLAFGWPALTAMFRFGPLHADDLLVCAGAGLAVVLALEALKPLWRAPVRG